MSEKKYTIESADGIHTVSGPGVAVGFDRTASARLVERACECAYAAGVEAGRAESKPTDRRSDDYQIVKLEARVAALEAAATPIRTANHYATADTTDWQRRAEIAEAQVEAAVDYIDAPCPEGDDYAKGTNAACNTIRHLMADARERFGAA